MILHPSFSDEEPKDVKSPENVEEIENVKKLSSQIEFLEKKNLDLQEQQNTFLYEKNIIIVFYALHYVYIDD